MSGYTIIEAADIDAAVAHAKAGPHLQAGGNIIAAESPMPWQCSPTVGDGDLEDSLRRPAGSLMGPAGGLFVDVVWSKAADDRCFDL